ncbi:microsomal glutathione S-transferase 1-like [Anopheles ziemanni]|uniref:microsomal glutathione S-transferase 1-like n=1 Tax=Anopheles ziemanni TaxID=345580 RepID=UPI00265A59D4|nr:microsomal glutathione S-transferase 1-like isoform X2 [Anopheles coustani]XP_058176530.1 microsomal glutathione S-transferase 1-like [Anopheles ziemanni]
MTNVFDSVNDAALRAYLFWVSVLTLKMLLMSPLTSVTRVRKMAFANPEDTNAVSRKLKPKLDDPDVERVRRAHQNDLENILPFFVIGFLYLLTDPAPFLAINLFRLVAASRIIHTLVYAVVVVPQPARFLAFIGAMLPMQYMAVKTILYFL